METITMSLDKYNELISFKNNYQTHYDNLNLSNERVLAQERYQINQAKQYYENQTLLANKTVSNMKAEFERLVVNNALSIKEINRLNNLVLQKSKQVDKLNKAISLAKKESGLKLKKVETRFAKIKKQNEKLLNHLTALNKDLI
jgi:hypothetical protein